MSFTSHNWLTIKIHLTTDKGQRTSLVKWNEVKIIGILRKDEEDTGVN